MKVKHQIPLLVVVSNDHALSPGIVRKFDTLATFFMGQLRSEPTHDADAFLVVSLPPRLRGLPTERETDARERCRWRSAHTAPRLHNPAWSRGSLWGSFGIFRSSSRAAKGGPRQRGQTGASRRALRGRWSIACVLSVAPQRKCAPGRGFPTRRTAERHIPRAHPIPCQPKQYIDMQLCFLKTLQYLLNLLSNPFAVLVKNTNKQKKLAPSALSSCPPLIMRVTSRNSE